MNHKIQRCWILEVGPLCVLKLTKIVNMCSGQNDNTEVEVCQRSCKLVRKL